MLRKIRTNFNRFPVPAKIIIFTGLLWLSAKPGPHLSRLAFDVGESATFGNSSTAIALTFLLLWTILPRVFLRMPIPSAGQWLAAIYLALYVCGCILGLLSQDPLVWEGLGITLLLLCPITSMVIRWPLPAMWIIGIPLELWIAPIIGVAFSLMVGGLWQSIDSSPRPTAR